MYSIQCECKRSEFFKRLGENTEKYESQAFLCPGDGAIVGIIKPPCFTFWCRAASCNPVVDGWVDGNMIYYSTRLPFAISISYSALAVILLVITIRSDVIAGVLGLTVIIVLIMVLKHTGKQSLAKITQLLYQSASVEHVVPVPPKTPG